jgi:cobalamin biosynthesis Mg chelatase CobN
MDKEESSDEEDEKEKKTDDDAKMDKESSDGDEDEEVAEEKTRCEGGTTKKVDETKEKPKSVGRPSAAALGFSTVGMTDSEVAEAMAQEAYNPKKNMPKKSVAKPKSKAKAKAKTKTGRKKQNVNESDDDSSSTSSSSTTSSTSSSDDENNKTENKAGPLVLSIREHFPMTNIRRWMTPGSRFPLPEMLQPLLGTKRKIQLELDDHWTKKTESPDNFSHQCLNDTSSDAKLGKEEEPSRKEKESEGERPKDDLPIPRHRRRTKSWRYSDSNDGLPFTNPAAYRAISCYICM